MPLSWSEVPDKHVFLKDMQEKVGVRIYNKTSFKRSAQSCENSDRG